MKYTAKSFTLPASSNWTTQMNWDRAFLPPSEFLGKYGVLPTVDSENDSALPVIQIDENIAE